MSVNPHDAEEALRPYLKKILEADAVADRNKEPISDVELAQSVALDKALELLGVQR